MNVEDILAKMTANEKIDLLCGADFWHSAQNERCGVPAFAMADGPHGVRYQAGASDMLGIHASEKATCFPTSAATACAWDEMLAGEIGAAIAEEALAFGVDAVLGPGLNVKRSPLCGRNFEYYSEDPYLAGRLGAAFVRGGQERGPGFCPKHFAANSQEYKRFASDDHIDERTLREIYLPAFEEAVKQRPAMVMSAYDKINGTYCGANKRLLTDILREEWGFDGLVVTDWGGMYDRAAGAKAGCDLSMPGGGTDHLQRAVRAALAGGELTEEELDRAAGRVIAFARRAAENAKRGAAFDGDAHHALAKRAAAESAVLLKNDGVLPLRAKKVALIGHMAKNPRYQGSGSSHIVPSRLDAMTDAAPGWTYVPGCDGYGETTDALLSRVREAARGAEVCVVAAGLPECYESEGFDRASMAMPEGHIRMIEAAASANPNTVVVLFGGSPVLLPWIDRARAVLYMGLPGQAGGGAAVDLLTGRANPCGKLAETWPLSDGDVPCAGYYGSPRRDAQYREGIYVGYRYYETAGAPVRFPFGHGLSYASFPYADLVIDGRTASASVTNAGDIPGAEIVQLYIAPPEGGLHRPALELKGFQKVLLAPGETKRVSFHLDDRSFAVWDGGWKVPGGRYAVRIGASARDIRLTAQIDVPGEPVPAPGWQPGSWYENPRGQPPKADFERMLGRRVPEPEPARRGTYTDENSILEMAEHSLVLRIVQYSIVRTVRKMSGGRPDPRDPAYRMTLSSSLDCPIYALVIDSCGAMPKNVAYGFLDIANGHFLRGIRRILRKP